MGCAKKRRRGEKEETGRTVMGDIKGKKFRKKQKREEKGKRKREKEQSCYMYKIGSLGRSKKGTRNTVIDVIARL